MRGTASSSYKARVSVVTFRSFITADGVKLALHERGQGNCNFVFQHGLCGAAPQPAEVTSQIDDVRLLTLECRGHGQSEAGDQSRFSIAQFADDIAAMIETTGGPVVLGGISMGAAISLRLAVTRPDLVRALILARPAWVTDQASANMRPSAFVGELLSEFSAQDAEKRFQFSDIARELEAAAPDNLQSLKGFFSRAPQDVTAALLTRISADGPHVDRAQVGMISVPTLVIGHEDDLIHPLAHAKELADLIPRSELAIITSKVRDKVRYVADFQTSLCRFLTKVCHAEASR